MVEAPTAAVQFPQTEWVSSREVDPSKEYAQKVAAMAAVFFASAMIVDGIANRNKGEAFVGGVILGVATYYLINSHH